MLALNNLALIPNDAKRACLRGRMNAMMSHGGGPQSSKWKPGEWWSKWINMDQHGIKLVVKIESSFWSKTKTYYLNLIWIL